jgi:hypothetical protein
MFRIEFQDSASGSKREGSDLHPGRVLIGRDEELFRAHVGEWSISDYRQQWSEALRRLSAGMQAALLVDLGTDDDAAQLWQGWPEGDLIVFQNHFLPRSALPAQRTPLELASSPEILVDYSSSPSEWRVARQDVQAFLAEV